MKIFKENTAEGNFKDRAKKGFGTKKKAPGTSKKIAKVAGESFLLKVKNQFNRIDDDKFDIVLEALLLSFIVFSYLTTNNDPLIIAVVGLFFAFVSLCMVIIENVTTKSYQCFFLLKKIYSY